MLSTTIRRTWKIQHSHIFKRFLAFDFCRFCVIIRFFIPATTANDLRLRRIFYPRFYPLHLFSYLYSWERASIFPFECSVLNKGTTGTIFITSLVWLGVHDCGLNPGPPALDASTLLLGYRWGGSTLTYNVIENTYTNIIYHHCQWWIMAAMFPTFYEHSMKLLHMHEYFPKAVSMNLNVNDE